MLMTAKFSIAVVSMAGLFPGAADLQTYWQNIYNGVEAVTDVTADRWGIDPALMYDPDGGPDKAISLRCGLVDSFAFDPSGFDIPADLLKKLDPLYQIGRASCRERV